MRPEPQQGHPRGSERERHKPGDHRDEEEEPVVRSELCRRTGDGSPPLAGKHGPGSGAVKRASNTTAAAARTIAATRIARPTNSKSPGVAGIWPLSVSVRSRTTSGAEVTGSEMLGDTADHGELASAGDA